jgi:hypothetical protein
MIHTMRKRAVEFNARSLRHAESRVIESAPPLCSSCGVPFDSQYFDESRIVDAPLPGQEVILAEFDLPPQYCGALEYFAQFTDQYAKDNSQIVTDGVVWRIEADGSPLFPYLSLDRIINPWGKGAFPIALRLSENVNVKMLARGVDKTGPGSAIPLTKVGGRLLGRFWYNTAYDNRGDDAARRRY